MIHDELTNTYRFDDCITTTTVCTESCIDELKEEIRRLEKQFEQLNSLYGCCYQSDDTQQCNTQLPDFSIEDIV